MSGFAVSGFSNIRLLRRGGFATVYSATDDNSGQVFAFKVLDRIGEIEESRFRRERESYERLASHPNIVGVVGGGRAPDGSPYLVMEYLPGGSLDDVVAAEGKMSADDTAWVADRILSALSFAHQHGVLHRDVKPSNVLLGLGTVKLGDFGVAKFQDVTQTTVSAVASTLSFAAPEVLRGEPATVASDLYSLGATLHNLVTGRSPTGSWQSTLADAVTRKPHDIDMSGVPEQMVSFLRHLLSSDSSLRPRTAAEARSELAPLVPENPSEMLMRYVEATPDSASPYVGASDGQYPTIVREPEQTVELAQVAGNTPSRWATSSRIIAGVLVCLVLGGGAIAASQLFPVGNPSGTPTSTTLSSESPSPSPSDPTPPGPPPPNPTPPSPTAPNTKTPAPQELVPGGVVGAPVLEAQKLLKGKSISYDITQRLVPANSPSIGTVVEVRPAEGSPLPSDRMVHLVVAEAQKLTSDLVLSTTNVSCVLKVSPGTDTVTIGVQVGFQDAGVGGTTGRFSVVASGSGASQSLILEPNASRAIFNLAIEAPKEAASKTVDVRATPLTGVPDSDPTDNAIRINFILISPQPLTNAPVTLTTCQASRL